MENSRRQPRKTTCQKRENHRKVDIHTAHGAHDENSAAGAQRTVHGQVSDIKDAERDKHADGHDAPYNALRDGTGQRR